MPHTDDAPIRCPPSPVTCPLSLPLRAFYSDRFVLPLPPGHRFPMEKYRRVRERCVDEGVVSPADLLQKVVSRLEHSVAYVRVGQVSGDVRVIAIDGHLPGDGSYGLSV